MSIVAVLFLGDWMLTRIKRTEDGKSVPPELKVGPEFGLVKVIATKLFGTGEDVLQLEFVHSTTVFI